MDEVKLDVDMDLSEAAFEQALLDLDFSSDGRNKESVYVSVNKKDFYIASRIVMSVSMLSNIDLKLIIEPLYDEYEWAVAYKDRFIHTKGA